MEWLNDVNALRESGFEQPDLNALSSSVMSVFGGMGSFNDYSPSIYNPDTGRYVAIPGTDDFQNVTSRVFDLALSLRVVGEY